ncbi:MAG: L-2-amino-thiazoline-4-carboxylic acid hydrolase [SAR324 cluster bacterium]|nr:L-2-amino-thiazoline-4-carboxylic acid hydrolase [SAR324 cluster bacterium]
MSEIPVLEKRRLQAEVIGPVFKEMVETVGRKTAEAVLDRAIRKAAIAEGKGYAQRFTESESPLKNFIALFENWQSGNALEIEVHHESDTRFDFDVTRCKYAEMYHEMGLGDIGHLLSCNRDGTFCEGFHPDLKLQRDQTLMTGAPCCTFRYTFKPQPEAE